MSDKGGLPRSILDTFAKDLRTKRWFERLQEQAIVLLPDQIKVINDAIEDVQGFADDAFTLAHAANTRPIDDVELLPLCISIIDDHELLPIPAASLDTTHGWAQYSDTVYTTGSPFAIAEGVTASIPNNAGSVIDQYLPLGVSSFYDGTKIRPDLIGDYCIVTIRFEAACSKVNGYAMLSIDVGGALGQISKNTIYFPKGIGVLHPFSVTLPCYMLDTFKANGGIVKLEAQLGDLTLATITYQIARVFSAQGA